jgi:putative FmdB family regulatory protein
MPIYEYHCEECSHCFEKLLFAGDADVGLRCPACGTEQIRKLVSCASTPSRGAGGLCSGSASSRFS